MIRRSFLSLLALGLIAGACSNNDHAHHVDQAIVTTHVHFRIEDKPGHLQCETCEGDTHNTLGNDGGNNLRDYMFDLNTPALPANSPYMGLLTATPTITTTLSTMTEATGGGYVRKLPTWTSTNPGSANNTASAASWTATGTAITSVTYLFLTYTSSGTTGKFLSFALLTGGPYTVNVGSTLNVTYTWSVSYNDHHNFLGPNRLAAADPLDWYRSFIDGLPAERKRELEPA